MTNPPPEKQPDLLERLNMLAYRDKEGNEAPCFSCGGYGHNDGCDFWKHLMQITHNAPPEITTPPEGYEWTGEFRIAGGNERVAAWSHIDGRWVTHSGNGADRHPILRKVKPPTVMVELPREWVEVAAKSDRVLTTRDISREIHEACREALENEE